MNVGDYVRTKYGKIGRIIAIGKNIVGTTSYLVEWSNCRAYYVSQVKDYKSSPNIIDLIEVGDYVDKLRVVDKYENYIVVETFDERIVITKEDTIKSIVTKEQFESMEYKL